LDKVRRAAYQLAVGLIAVWTGYCLLDLVYVALGYWSLAPGLGLLPIFTAPEVQPGFWGDYLKRLTTSWGSVVTGAGVIALLVRQPGSGAVRTIREEPLRTYPIIPEEERTEPRLLFIEEPKPPRMAVERERPPARGPGAEPALARQTPREPASRPAAETSRPRIIRSAPPLSAIPPAQEREEQIEGEPRRHPMLASPIVRALRGRSPSTPQARRAEPGEEEDTFPEPRLFSGGSRDEYGYFEVEYEDGSATVERLRRSEFGGDDKAGIQLVRQRLAERAAEERRPMRAISAVTPVVYSGISKR
jgi:hypothetical protein